MSAETGHQILLSTALFPPPYYFALIMNSQHVTIENHEHYIKQTYRNRYIINTAGKASPLIVPVNKTNGNHTQISKVEIDYHEQWPRTHARALETAYGSSPFFEYLKDDIFELFDRKPLFLTELNQSALDLMMHWLGIKTKITNSTEFAAVNEKNIFDWRYKLNPKDNLSLPTQSYFQGLLNDCFLPNLSILDLLFNLGPESKSYICNIPLP